MIEAFVDIIFPPVQESLSMEVLQYKVRPKKRLPKRVLFERVRLLDDQSADNVFSGFRPVARSSDLLKASRAKRLLQKRETQKGELKASASESGVDLDSDNSEDELSETLLQDRAKESPFRVIWKDEEHQCLIVNLCKALAYLGRYWEALEIINFTVRLA
ncbi:hypothetical protein CDL15_Pgr014748 [Punica granatum]|nr:hypothetical protein CDL15_Pgr014748 [Punica granatum]